MIHSTEQARKLLLQEYPHLNNQNLEVVKQFTAENGRTYNTFLVKSDKKMFVAKSIVHPKNPLSGEWYILKKLNILGFPAPKLVESEHVPEHFLLLEYIEGVIGYDLPQDEDLRRQVFYQAGLTSGLLHSISVKGYGRLLLNENIDWLLHVSEKVDQRINGSRDVLDPNLFNKIIDYWNLIKPVLESEKGKSPVLIHKDLYLDNFILVNNFEKAVLIDYIMAIGGRPINDLAKFYIWELYKNPQYKEVFLNGYFTNQQKPENYYDLLKLYIFKEAIGMIDFFNKINHLDSRDHAVKVISELTEGEGTIIDLINQ